MSKWNEADHPRGKTSKASRGGSFRKKAAVEEARRKHAAPLPQEPGTATVREGWVRLYHQTTEENLKSIEKRGLSIKHAKGIEGPRAIYASKTPFYGSADSRPTFEFQVPKKDFDTQFVMRNVPPSMKLGAHFPWHSNARSLLKNPEIRKEVLSEKPSSFSGDLKKAVSYVRNVTTFVKIPPAFGKPKPLRAATRKR